jgi:hypothetical protein
MLYEATIKNSGVAVVVPFKYLKEKYCYTVLFLATRLNLNIAVTKLTTGDTNDTIMNNDWISHKMIKNTVLTKETQCPRIYDRRLSFQEEEYCLAYQMPLCK